MTVPVLIIAGFLGAGKTTLVRQLLSKAKGRRLAVLVNDFGDLALDAALISEVSDDVMELKNGCICCSTRGDLLIAAEKLLQRKGEIDGLIVEASGLSLPRNIAATFEARDFSESFHVQAIVTLIDCASFADLDFDAGELAIEQAYDASLVVLNKVDLAGPDTAAEVRQVIEGACPHAVFLESGRSDLSLHMLLDSPLRQLQTLHDLERSFSSLGAWQSVSWQYDGRLDLDRALAALDALPKSILRVKGYLAPQGEDGPVYLVQKVGARGEVILLRECPPDTSTHLVLIGPRAPLEAFDVSAHFSRAALEGV